MITELHAIQFPAENAFSGTLHITAKMSFRAVTGNSAIFSSWTVTGDLSPVIHDLTGYG